MNALGFPQHSISNVVAAISRNEHYADVAANLPLLEAEEERFIRTMQEGDVSAYPRTVEGMSNDLHVSVKTAYSARFSGVDSAAGTIYSNLRAAAKLCPTCSALDVTALDHYLPKKHFPGLALHPCNLVPICDTCNKAKAAKVATSRSDQFFHPYFDDFDDWTWLVATLQEKPLAPVTYGVVHPDGWTEERHSRVVHHFKRFSLAALYAKKAASLLSDWRGALDRFSEQETHDFLKMMAASYANGERRWLAPAISAWAESSWFCRGEWK